MPSRNRLVRSVALLAASSLVGAALGAFAAVVRRSPPAFPLNTIRAGYNPPAVLPTAAPVVPAVPVVPAAPLVVNPFTQVRLTFAAVIGFVAFCLFCAAALYFDRGGEQPIETDFEFATGVLAAVTGVLTLGAALWLARRPPMPRITAAPLARSRVRFRWAVPGVALLAVLAVLNGGYFLYREVPNVHYGVQMLMLTFGMVFLAWGMGGVRGVRLWRRERWQAWAREHALLLGIIALALVVRFWGLESLLHTWIDEFLFADALNEMHNDPTIDMLAPLPTISSIIGTYPYMEEITTRLFGNDLFGLRAPSAILGALTVPAVYVLADALFNRKTALLAALLLAVFPPHVHFSRLALYNIADPVFGAWAFAFFARAVRYNQRPDWSYGGVMLALSHYFYEAGRLLFTPLALVWFFLLLFTPVQPANPTDTPHLWRRRFAWNGMSTAVVAFVIAVAPLYYTWSAQRLGLTPRFDDKRVPVAFVSQIPDYGKEITRAWRAFQTDAGSEVVREFRLIARNLYTDFSGDLRRIADFVKPDTWDTRRPVDLRDLRRDILRAIGDRPLHFARRLGVVFERSAESGGAAFRRVLFALPETIRRDIVSYFTGHFRPPLFQLFRDTDGSSFYYGGQTSILLFYLIPFFLFGTVYLAWRPRAPGALLLILWTLAGLAGNSLIGQNNWTARFVVIFPALSLIVAVGIVGLFALVVPPDPLAPARTTRTRATLTTLVALILAALQVVYYFGAHLPFYNRQVRGIKDHIDLAYRARALPPDTQVLIITDDLVWFDHFTILEGFWDWDMHYEKVEPTVDRSDIVRVLLAIEPETNLAFFIEPEDLATFRWLDQTFDLGAPQFSPYNVPDFAQYALYYVPASSITFYTPEATAESTSAAADSDS